MRQRTAHPSRRGAWVSAPIPARQQEIREGRSMFVSRRWADTPAVAGLPIVMIAVGPEGLGGPCRAARPHTGEICRSMGHCVGPSVRALGGTIRRIEGGYPPTARRLVGPARDHRHQAASGPPRPLGLRQAEPTPFRDAAADTLFEGSLNADGNDKPTDPVVVAKSARSGRRENDPRHDGECCSEVEFFLIKARHDLLIGLNNRVFTLKAQPAELWASVSDQRPGRRLWIAERCAIRPAR